ncbi:MAG: hypothetical protein ACXAEX_06605 [Promethearchaeota archaeon]
MVLKIKKINLTIFAPDPEKRLSKGLDYTINIDDNGTIVDALSKIDKKMYSNPDDTVFPLFKGLIYSYLQLIWDGEENRIYEDCAINAYGPNREFMNLQDDVDTNLYPNSKITIVVHAD